MSLTSDMTLSEVLRVRPGAASLFDDVGIDYACGGGTTLKSAAASSGLTANELIELVDGCASDGRDWNALPLSELTRYLAHDHQRLLAGLLPRVRAAIDAAVECHGHLALLNRMGDLCESLSVLIADHSASEERELFPIVDQLEGAAPSSGIPPPQARISARVLREFIEHESIRDRVHTLRDLAAELLAGCDVSVLAAHVRAFQRHLNMHMHLENNVLYPRAIAIENGLRHPAAVY